MPCGMYISTINLDPDVDTWTQALPKLGLSQKTVHYVLIIPLSLRALGTPA